MTKSLITLLIAVMALATACTTDTDTPADSTGPSAARTPTRCDPELDAALNAWAEAGFSGAVAVAAGGEPVCEAGYGLADRAAGTPNMPDTVFSIGSVTKAFTTAAIFDLVDDGVVAPDDRVGDLLPQLTGPIADATLMQLMTHTSGLNGSHGDDHQPLERDTALAAIDALEPAFEPGGDYLYSNAGYTLLALVIERVSDTGYRGHTMADVLSLPDGGTAGGFWDGEPAAPGPRAVGYFDDGTPGESGGFGGPHWALDGNGALAMTMPQLAEWTHALFTGQIVSQESADVIAAPQVDLGEGRSETPGWVAFDDSAYGRPFLSAAGGGGDVGHDAVVVWVPEAEQVIAIASNAPEVSAEELLAAVGPALASGEPVPVPDDAGNGIGTGPAAAAAVGGYELETGGSYDVTAGADGLRITATGADAVETLFPLGDDVQADTVRAHEEHVKALLAGGTDASRAEIRNVESLVGPITDVALAGTIVADGELRTYVIISTQTEQVTAWYALNEEGGIMAALVDTDPPTLDLVADGTGYRPRDPAGTGPAVRLEFSTDTLVIDGPDGSVTARRAG